MESVVYFVKSNCDNRELARNNYMPPLGLMSIANVLRLHGYYVEIIDLSIKNYSTEDINQIIQRLDPLLIGFSVYTENVDATFNMCKYFKRRFPHIPIVFGGPHPTLDSTYCMRKRYVDFISMGDGEQNSLELVEAIPDEASAHQILRHPRPHLPGRAQKVPVRKAPPEPGESEPHPHYQPGLHPGVLPSPQSHRLFQPWLPRPVYLLRRPQHVRREIPHPGH